MNFLDESGLKKLWTKIKASMGTAVVNISDYKKEVDALGTINIPFVANHQIISMDITSSINLYNWFQKASKGGILELFFSGSLGGDTYCSIDGNSYMYRMQVSSKVPTLDKIERLMIVYGTYARLIKITDDKLIVAEFVATLNHN